MDMYKLFLCLSAEEKQTLKILLQIEQAHYTKSERTEKTLFDFIRDKNPSVRLQRCLTNNFDMSVDVNSLKREDLCRIRNFGRKSMLELEELRGF